MTRRVAAVVCVLMTAGAIAPGAQGLSIRPSFDMSVVADDNLFHRPAGEGDVAVRFSPRLDAVYRSERLSLTSRYALDAERFDRHPELTTAHARQDASFDAGYGVSRRLSIAAAAAFTDTQSPSDLNGVTAITPGRMPARRLTVRPSATYALGPRALASVGYTVTSETLQGGASLTTRSATSALEHRFSARHRLRMEYLDQHFLFAGGDARTSRALTAEWTRDVARGTAVTLRVGPRLTSGVLAPEIAASARHELRAGAVALSYLQTQTTLIGLPGIARARSLMATAERDVRSAVRVRGASGVVEARQAGLSSVAYRVSASCAWRPAGRVGIEVGYDTDVQRGNLYATLAAETIRRHVATVKFVIDRRGRGRPWA